MPIPSKDVHVLILNTDSLPIPCTWLLADDLPVSLIIYNLLLLLLLCGFLITYMINNKKYQLLLRSWAWIQWSARMNVDEIGFLTFRWTVSAVIFCVIGTSFACSHSKSFSSHRQWSSSRGISSSRWVYQDF